MAEADDVKVQSDEDDKAAAGTTQEKAFAARRRFLRQALAVTSSVALAEFLPPALLKAAGPSQAQCPPVTDLTELTRVGEIARNGNNLQAVLRVVDGERTVPTSIKTAVKTRLRYYIGHNPDDPSQSWPPKDQPAPAPPGPPGPGPTLRCSVGDNVQITFLNQVNVTNFPDSLANGEYGRAEGCDELRVIRITIRRQTNFLTACTPRAPRTFTSTGLTSPRQPPATTSWSTFGQAQR